MTDTDANRPYFDLSTTRLSVDDALKCLTGEYFVGVPTPSAKPCENLDQYLYRSKTKNYKGGDGKQQSSSKPLAVPLLRNFERIMKQEARGSPSSRPTAPKKARVDVFTKAQQIQSSSGPILHLKNRLNQVVKVLIRRRKKVPYISRIIEYKGTLIIFDKHMNMLLRDVIESFKYERDGKILKRGRHRDEIIVRGDNVILVA